VLGVGYDTITDILSANLALKLLVALMIAKAAWHSSPDNRN
jgi:hypothetical protein